MARPTISRKPRIIDGFSEKQSAALLALFARNDDTLQQLAQLDASARIFTADTVARAGQFLRVSPPDSRGMAVLLPSPDSTQPGDTISVSLEGPLGDLRVSCVPNQGGGARVTLGTVNGQDRATFTAAGLIVFTSNGATGWTTAAEHPAESAAAPSITPTSSVEILPSNPSGSIWTWALRPFSVVLGRLAKQVGLSVIGNASDALAGLSAITATAARQALLSNSAGTAIGWRALEIADLADVDADSFLGNITSSSGAVTANSLSTLAGSSLTYAGSGVINWDGVLVSQGPTGIGTFRSLDFLDGTNTTANLSDAGGGVVAIAYDVDLSSVTYTAGDGLTLASNEFSVDASAIAGGGLVGFGSVLAVVGGDGIDVAADSVAVDVSDFAGTGLEDDGSNNLRIAASAAGDGLTGGGGSALAVGGSTSIIVGANDVQRAALTGEVTASQNSNATTVTRSTNFQSSPWTGQHQFNDNVYHSGFVAIGAKATVDAYALGDIRSAGDLDILASATGTASLIAGTAILRNGLFTAAVQCDDDGVRLSAPGSGDLVDIWANSVRIASGLAGTGAGFLRIVESGSSVISLSAGEGMHWVRNDTPNMPMFTDDDNVDHELAYRIDDDGKDVRTMSRCVFWDDFCTVEGATFGGGAFGAITCDTGWIITNNSLTGTATITQVDGGTGGPSNAPGQLQISTSSSTGTQIDMTKGNNNTARWLRASDVKSLKMRVSVQQSTSVHVTFGLNDSSFGSTDCARFDFDSSLDSTWHIISNANSGTADNDDTNVTPGTGMHMLEIRSPSPSSLDWEFYRDGTLVGTQTVSTKTRGVNVHLSIANLAASDRTVRVDCSSLETWELSR